MAEKNSERLARYIITLMTIILVAGVIWYFKNIIIYIVLAAVMALVGRPIYIKLIRPSIRGHHLPDWIAAIISIIVILALILSLITLVIPVVSSVIGDISKANIEDMAQAVSVPLKTLNENIIHAFPKVGPDFRIEKIILSELNGMLDMSKISSMMGSVASFAASFGIGLFSMIFISFFFIKDPKIFTKLVLAFVPDQYDKKVKESLNETGVLVSRYFTGLFTELLGVALINFLGLLLIAKLGFKYSIGIAFITGIFNIVPYIGPLFGGIIGILLSVIIKYVCATSFGAAVSFPVFLIMLIAIFVVTQWIDNYIFQPFIYSNSIKAHPLEIFIVFLIAGHIGGMLGMLAAIPAYTVARVFALKFLGDFKAIRMLKGED